MSEQLRLSPSIAKILLRKSPLHAWATHRLGGNLKDEPTDPQQRGRTMDKMLLGVGPEIVVCRNPKRDKKGAIIEPVTYEDGWRTDAIKEMRDAAIAAGKMPVLPGKESEYTNVISAWRSQLEARGIAFEGAIQQRLTWDSEGCPCSGQPDHAMHGDDETIVIDDLKTVEDASDEAVTRAIVSYGYDVQAAAYVEGMEHEHPDAAGRVHMRFIFCEVGAPYAVNVKTLGGTMRELGQRKWRRAKRAWAACLAAGRWPGYESGAPVEATEYQLSDEMKQQVANMANDKETPF